MHWLYFMTHNFFPFTPIIMKLQTQTPHESRMCPIYFGVKMSRSQCIDYRKWLCRIIALPSHLSSWNFTHRLPMSQGFTLVILGSNGQRSRLQYNDYWKWLMLHNSFPFTTTVMKLKTKTPHRLRMCPIDFGVIRSMVKVTMHWLLKMVIGALLLFLCTYHHETSHTDSPWVEDVLYRFLGPKVKVTMHWLLKMVIFA